MDVAIVFALIIVIVALYVTMILGSVDTLDQPREAWSLAGYRRNRWVWQALGVLCLPAGIIYSGLYFFRVRPRLRGVTRELAFETFRRQAGLLPAALPVGPQPDEIRIGMPWSVAVATAAGPLLACGVSLADEAAEPASHRWILRGFLRRRIAWPDVLAITQHASLGARYVRLWTSTDRSRRLRAPVTCFGVGRRRFETDFAAIRPWWLAHAQTTG